MEFAQAYNNWGSLRSKREALKKAIALLKPHREYFEGDHFWNFRMGYAYYYLDQDGRALSYFRKALDARPDDEDTKELIGYCEALSSPVIKCKKTPRKKCSFVAEEAKKR